MHPLGAGRSPTDELERKTAHDTVYFTPPVYANFVSRIKTDFELTKGDLLLAALIKLGFSSKQLMIVFDCEMKSVYKSKQRLKSHLKLEKEDSLEEMIAFY